MARVCARRVYADVAQQFACALSRYGAFLGARGGMREERAPDAGARAHMAADHDVFKRAHVGEQADVLERARDAGLGQHMRLACA